MFRSPLRLWLRHPPDRFPGHGAECDEQDDRVGEGGQDRAAAEAVGAPGRRSACGEDAGALRDEQTEDIAEIVSGVGEQGDRVGPEAEDRLVNDEVHVERGADRERGSEVVENVRMAAVRIVVGLRMSGMIVFLSRANACIAVRVKVRPGRSQVSRACHGLMTRCCSPKSMEIPRYCHTAVTSAW